MYIRRFDSDLDPCKACNEHLVALGFAPSCYGCDGQLLRKQLREDAVSTPEEAGLTHVGAVIWRSETVFLKKVS